MTTPMRKQYLEIKRRYPDAIVVFRLGNFQETFDEDAKVGGLALFCLQLALCQKAARIGCCAGITG